MNHVPALGVGSFRLQGAAALDSVRTALEVGYRAIDTAQIYGNEAEVGQAIAQAGVPREQLFVTTKIWVDNLSKDKLIPSLQDSLKKLGTEQVDLTLIHWPAFQTVSLAEAMTALAEAKAQGLTRLIGVSNFNIDLTQQAMDVVGAEEIATNQIELSPYLQNHKLVDFLQARGMDVTSYMTLAYGKVLGDPVIAGIAAAHRATPAQVVLAWALQRGFAVIPSSTQRSHLASNLLAPQLHLSDSDMAQMAALERDDRQVSPAGLAPLWD